jgi:hypothetical protein
VNLVLGRRPPPLFIPQGDRGPPAIDRLDASDQDASQGPKGSRTFYMVRKSTNGESHYNAEYTES